MTRCRTSDAERQNVGSSDPAAIRGARARFQAEWIPVSRPESAPNLKERARSDAKPVSAFAERALEHDPFE
jgi:hypothetical protein